MPIRENVGFDHNGFAGDAFYRKSPCIDFGMNILDNDTPSSVNLIQIRHEWSALFERSNLPELRFRRSNFLAALSAQQFLGAAL